MVWRQEKLLPIRVLRECAVSEACFCGVPGHHGALVSPVYKSNSESRPQASKFIVPMNEEDTNGYANYDITCRARWELGLRWEDGLLLSLFPNVPTFKPRELRQAARFQ